jgi:hypothetical protein
VADAPLPGTTVFARRERLYLQAMIGARIFDPSAISETDFDIYASADARPGAMRAGLEGLLRVRPGCRGRQGSHQTMGQADGAGCWPSAARSARSADDG